MHNLFFLSLLLCLYNVFSSPINEGDESDDFKMQVEEMRTKLAAWATRVERRRVLEIAGDKSKHEEASGSNRRSSGRADLHKSKSDAHAGRTQEFRQTRRHSDDYSQYLHGTSSSENVVRRRPKVERPSVSPGSRGRQIVPYKKEKPVVVQKTKEKFLPIESYKEEKPVVAQKSKEKKLSMVPYKEKKPVVVQKRKEKSLEDLQKLQNEMKALVLHSSEQAKPLRSEANAMRLASTDESMNNVLRPKCGGLLSKLSRKMTLEPENWMHGLENMLKSKNTYHGNQMPRHCGQYNYYGYYDSYAGDVSNTNLGVSQTQSSNLPVPHEAGTTNQMQENTPSLLLTEAGETSSGTNAIENESPNQLYLEGTKDYHDDGRTSSSDEKATRNTGKYKHGSRKYAYDQKHHKKNGDIVDLDEILNFQSSRIGDQQGYSTTNDDTMGIMGDSDKDEALKYAMNLSLTESEKSMAELKNREDEQLRIAMENSMMDEFQRRQHVKKGKNAILVKLLHPDVINGDYDPDMRKQSGLFFPIVVYLGEKC